MEIDRTIFHPDYKQEPYWWEAARPGTKFAVVLPKEMEIFIIGSGYSGLSAALELAREGRDVSVVDALAFGEAASSRNGGGVSAGVNIGKGISGGPGQANRSESLLNGLLSESAAAFEFVRTLIDREGIECHFEKEAGLWRRDARAFRRDEKGWFIESGHPSRREDRAEIRTASRDRQ